MNRSENSENKISKFSFFREKKGVKLAQEDVSSLNSITVASEVSRLEREGKQEIRTLFCERNLLLNPNLSDEEKEQTLTLYINASFQIKKLLEYLAIQNFNEIQETIKNFNKLFSEEVLTKHSSVTPLMGNPLFQSLDYAQITTLESKASEVDKTQAEKNYILATLFVLEQAANNQQESSLIYHNGEHTGIEVPFDIFTLMTMTSFSEQPMQLLMTLIGVFHDAVFKRQRIIDERASAEALKLFLRPILIKLHKEQSKIICSVIDVMILGATSPVFLKYEKKFKEDGALNAQKGVRMTSVFHIAESLLSRDLKNKVAFQLIAKLVRLVKDADVNKTSCPRLNATFDSSSPIWAILNQKFYNDAFLNRAVFQLNDVKISADIPHLMNALKTRLTQGLRVMTEVLAENLEIEDFQDNHSPLTSTAKLVKLVREAQRGVSAEVAITENDLQFLADKLKSEAEFSPIMSNSCEENYARDYLFVNHWALHAVFMQSIAEDLLNLDNSLDERKKLYIALTKVAAEQPGRQNAAEKTVQIARGLHLMIEAEKIEEQAMRRCCGSRC